MTDSMEIIKMMNALRKNPEDFIDESKCEIAYKQLLQEIDVLLSSDDIEFAYQKISYIRVEVLCMKETTTINDNITLFYLNKALHILDANLQLVSWRILGYCSTPKANRSTHENEVLWTGGVSELVELGYSLIESKRINNGDIHIKIFMKRLSDFLNFEVKDCFNIFREIRKRKLHRTVFLDTLKENLIRRMEMSDN